jgi:hypothetical protein
MCAESPASGARFVGRQLLWKTRYLKKDTSANLTKLLHQLLTLATAKNIFFKN